MLAVILLAAAAALAALYALSRRVYLIVHRRGRVRAAAAYAVFLFILLIPAAALLAKVSDRIREKKLAGEVEVAANVIDQFTKSGLSRMDKTGPGETLLKLLSGDEVQRTPSVQFQPILLKQPGSERLSAEGNLPFLLLDRNLKNGETLRFPVDPQEKIESIAAAMPAGAEDISIDIIVVGPGTSRRMFVLDASAPRAHGWGEGSELVEIRTLKLTPAALGAAAIEVRAASAARIVGLSIETSASAPARSLVSEERTRSGLPVWTCAGSLTNGVSVRSGNASVEYLLDPPVLCDALWFVYTSIDPKASDYRWFGEDIIEIRLEYAGDSVPEQYTLRHGEDIHSGNLDRSRHADDLESSVAWTWENDGVHWHADERRVAFDRTRNVKKILLKNVAGSSGYNVELLGITAGRKSGEGSSTISNSALMTTIDGNKVRLHSNVKDTLGDASFAFVDRRGVIRAVTRSAPSSILGVTVDAGDIAEFTAGRTVAPKCGQIAGIECDISIVPVRENDTVIGATIVFRPEEERGFRRGKFAFLPLIFGILIFPFLVIVFAEELARGERIRRKIAIALAVAALVPAGIMILVIPPAFDRTRSDATIQRLESELHFWKERFNRKREAAQAESAAFFKNLREHPRVFPLFAGPVRPDSEQSLKRELAAARIAKFSNEKSFVRLELRTQRAEGSPWRIIDDASESLSLEGIDFQGSDYYKIQNRLFLAGVDRTSPAEYRSRFILGSEVVMSVDTEVDTLVNTAVDSRSERGRRARIVTLGGIPLDGQPLPEGLLQLEAADQIANALRENRPAVYTGASTSIVDVFRDSNANPAFAIVVSETGSKSEILLFGARIPLSTLLAILALIGVAGTLTIARIITETITRPIERLARAADEARTAKSLVPVEVGSADEVGLLAERFHAMSSELVEQIHQLSEIQRGILTFAGRLDREEVAREACKFAKRVTNADVAILLIADAQGAGWRAFYSNGRDRTVKITDMLLHIIGADEWAAFSDDGPSSHGFLERAIDDLPPKTKSILGGPVRLGQRNEGFLILSFSTVINANVTNPGQRQAARACASAIAIALENARAYGLAIEDSRTGALVPHFFEQKLVDAVERARALHQRVWIIKIKILAQKESSAAIESKFINISRRLARFSQYQRRGFAGRTAALELAIVVESFDINKRAPMLRALRKFIDRSARDPVFQFEIRDILFPDEAASTEDLLRRLTLEEPNLQKTIDLGPLAGGIKIQSNRMIEMLNRASRLAALDLPVLVVGESGTGKEALAQQIHLYSHAAESPFIVVSLALLNADLAEAELFGVAAGAFSGATDSRRGLIESANGGTLLLTDIQDASLNLQAKILRAIESKSIRRLGSSESIPLSVRIVSSSSRDLLDEIKAGRFRSDLYYRLAGAILVIPALRERLEDIPALVRQILDTETNGNNVKIAPQAMDRLLNHTWPGNLTELRSVLKQALLIAKSDVIEATDIEISRLIRFAENETPVPTLRAKTHTALTRATAHSNPAERAWNERQQRLLAMLKRGDRITTTEYVSLMNVSSRTGLRDLDELVRWGRLRREGRKRGMWFKMM
ncbi:MAG: sigma 54-interacting transcriptional regulator [Planctomycetota bacterium]